MIVDLTQFIESERPYWRELETFLDRFSRDFTLQLTLDEACRFHYLYQRASAALSKIQTFSAEVDLKRHLENLVSRAYCEIHGEGNAALRFTPLNWFFGTFPREFRAHIRGFQLALLVTLVGAIFGAVAVHVDPEAKEVILPFNHLLGSPNERVLQEESQTKANMDEKTTFSAYLMTHNIKVTFMTMAMGVVWGLGSILLLFYNGVILGAVIFDYMAAGESLFLLGWLLPHGVIEIPAILMGGQAGLVFGHALIGWGTNDSLRVRLKKKISSIVTLVFGAAFLLIWAGIVEAFLSQFHYPVVPYSAKIGFGVVELIILISFLRTSGRQKTTSRKSSHAV